jgi:hypothetical protein
MEAKKMKEGLGRIEKNLQEKFSSQNDQLKKIDPLPTVSQAKSSMND